MITPSVVGRSLPRRLLERKKQKLITWIKVRHAATGGETQIPERSLDAYRKRGWHLPADLEAAETAESTPVVVDEPGDHITEENP